MSSKSIREYIQTIKEHYKKSKKAQKTLLLDNFVLVTKLDRKHSIKLMHKELSEVRDRRGRPEKYQKEVYLPHIKTLWFAMQQLGSKKMKEALPLWLPYYSGETVTEEIKEELLKMSHSTIERFLALIRFQTRKKGLSTTRRGKYLMHTIPLKPLDWKVTKPGFIEADTVAHCGDNIMGEYTNSLNVTDVLSTWTETRATFTKASGGIIRRLKDIEESFPFPLYGFSSDNGTEFLNYALVEHFEGRKENPITMRRGRPYRSNDQAHIEQKNLTHVRELFGYDRVEYKDLTEMMNEIYKDYWCPFLNFFIPTMKLIQKERFGSKVKKKYDKPRTPYQRVLESPDVTDAYKDVLKSRYQGLNPFTLQEELEKKLKAFFKELRHRQIKAA